MCEAFDFKDFLSQIKCMCLGHMRMITILQCGKFNNKLIRFYGDPEEGHLSNLGRLPRGGLKLTPKE